MSAHLQMDIRMRCNRHRGYNPELDGQSGIVGGCIACTQILVLYQMANNRFAELSAQITRAAAERDFFGAVRGKASKGYFAASTGKSKAVAAAK